MPGDATDREILSDKSSHHGDTGEGLASEGNDDEEKWQSLNPFADNFLPPGSVKPRNRHVVDKTVSKPLAADDAKGDKVPRVSLRQSSTTQTLQFRVLTDGLMSREILGDVAVDLAVLVRSRGTRLQVNRIHHHKGDSAIKAAGGPRVPEDLPIAVDTWIPLQNGYGELRLQILIYLSQENGAADNQAPVSISIPKLWEQTACAKEATGAQTPVRSRLQTWDVTSESGATNRDNTYSRTDNRSLPSARHPGPRVEGDQSSWPKYDEMVVAGRVKVSSFADDDSFDTQLLRLQETYDFSVREGYRTGKPDDMFGPLGHRAPREEPAEVAEWPDDEAKVIQLQGFMQLAACRERQQQLAWAEKLAQSPTLQRAVRAPPPFGSLHTEQSSRKMRQGSRSSSVRWICHDLARLIAASIPASLRHNASRESVQYARLKQGESGGAFEGDNDESGLSHDVSAVIPQVEVVRVSGRLCCAEYTIQVSRGDVGDSWCVLRRYSDFADLYNTLPRSLAAITPPLPPKSWRSLSFLSMTPEFLEDRRVALEVALRRLIINAIRADFKVQADVRAFLGFPARADNSLLAGVEAAVVRHMVRVPSPLELNLEASRIGSVSLVDHCRVVMWMVLSGAAYKCLRANDRESYQSLARSCSSLKQWERGGGSKDQFARGSNFFQTIDEDVNRTNVRDSAERESIREVLKAFALANPDTGYCQGMNSVVAFLLRAVNGREELAFWLLDSVSNVVMPGYWRGLSHLSTPRVGRVSLRGLIQARLPHLLEHLDSRGLPPELLLCDFMLSLGCRALPPSTVLRIWDVLLWRGGDTIQYVAYAVLCLAKDELLRVQGAAASSECLVRQAASMHDADALIGIVETEMERSRLLGRGRVTR